MSVVFHISNQKESEREVPVLTVAECLALIEGLTQFSFDETSEDFAIDELHALPLSRLECLLVGIDGQSGRGFEIGYDQKEKSYNVRVNTPAVEADWELALQFMQILARKLGSPIVEEDGVSFTPETITDFDYKEDINYGLEVFCKQALESGSSIVFGVWRPVCIDRKLAEELLASSDRLKRFEELVHKTQYTDAYAAHQAFFINREDDSLIGSYTLTQELPTILPYQPYVEFDNQELIGEREVRQWLLTLVCYEQENDPESYYALGEMDYSSFIRKLAPEKYYFLDGTYIVVAGLSKEEMMELLK